MFIVSNRLWGPIAGIAAALLFVLIVGKAGESPSPVAAAGATQVATTTFDTHR
jgi:hypothetical protein